MDNPVSLYAATKKSNELMAHAYSKLYNIPSTGLRFFTVYGPAGRPDMAYFGFTNKLLKGETIQIENRESESARAYGRYQNVFLTDEELADLQASFPTVWGQYIEKLSEYMASTGKRYQSHAATIRRWAGEDAKKAAPPTRNRDYSVKEDETV